MEKIKLVIPKEQVSPAKLEHLKLNLNGHKPRHGKNSYNKMLNKIRRFLR